MSYCDDCIHSEVCGIEDAGDEALKFCADKLTKEVWHWIPVSERLPEKSGRYLCTHGGTYLRGIDFYETPNDALKDEIDDSGWRSQNVIAWMPLPEPYKEESEEV